MQHSTAILPLSVIQLSQNPHVSQEQGVGRQAFCTGNPANTAHNFQSTFLRDKYTVNKSIDFMSNIKPKCNSFEIFLTCTNRNWQAYEVSLHLERSRQKETYLVCKDWEKLYQTCAEVEQSMDLLKYDFIFHIYTELSTAYTELCSLCSLQHRTLPFT